MSSGSGSRIGCLAARGHVRRTAKDNRLFMEAVLYRYRAGIPWRDLPERFGDCRVIHTLQSRWSQSGVWQWVFQVLATDADNEYAMIDSTIVRAYQHCAGMKKGGKAEAIGRSRGGLSTKIHATVDALGNPTGFHLTGGQAHDLEGAEALLPCTPADIIIADKTYDAKERVIKPLQRAGKSIVIASQRARKHQREYDSHLYRDQHLIEQFFSKLKQYRSIATRYPLPATRYPLRQDCPYFPWSHPPCRRYHLA